MFCLRYVVVIEPDFVRLRPSRQQREQMDLDADPPPTALFRRICRSSPSALRDFP